MQGVQAYGRLEPDVDMQSPSLRAWIRRTAPQAAEVTQHELSFDARTANITPSSDSSDDTAADNGRIQSARAATCAMPAAAAGDHTPAEQQQQQRKRPNSRKNSNPARKRPKLVPAAPAVPAVSPSAGTSPAAAAAAAAAGGRGGTSLKVAELEGGIIEVTPGVQVFSSKYLDAPAKVVSRLSDDDTPKDLTLKLRVNGKLTHVMCPAKLSFGNSTTAAAAAKPVNAHRQRARLDDISGLLDDYIGQWVSRFELGGGGKCVTLCINLQPPAAAAAAAASTSDQTQDGDNGWTEASGSGRKLGLCHKERRIYVPRKLLRAMTGLNGQQQAGPVVAAVGQQQQQVEGVAGDGHVGEDQQTQGTGQKAAPLYINTAVYRDDVQIAANLDIRLNRPDLITVPRGIAEQVLDCALVNMKAKAPNMLRIYFATEETAGNDTDDHEQEPAAASDPAAAVDAAADDPAEAAETAQLTDAARTASDDDEHRLEASRTAVPAAVPAPAADTPAPAPRVPAAQSSSPAATAAAALAAATASSPLPLPVGAQLPAEFSIQPYISTAQAVLELRKLLTVMKAPAAVAKQLLAAFGAVKHLEQQDSKVEMFKTHYELLGMFVNEYRSVEDVWTTLCELLQDSSV